MFGRSTASFDRLLEKATSQLLLEPDWASIMMICDSIRQGDTNAKYAVAAIKKKFYHQNPHAALYALQVMESCVKNCGVLIHDEIATKVFMEEMRELVKQTTDDNIKNKVLELIQIWGTAFRNSPKYRIVTDTLHLMQAEGWKFPPVREAEAMFEADTAPEWADGEVCHRCRVQFSTFTRQHHCRACGQVFCGKCSGKSCVLPKFGIEREVRVCDSCFDKYGPKEGTTAAVPAAAAGSSKDTDLPAEYLASPLSKQSQGPVAKPGKTDAELKEEEELQLVLALSKSEAEEKEKQKKKSTSEILAGIGQNKQQKVSTNGINGGGSSAAVRSSPEEADPELAKYLNRDYWESKSQEAVLLSPSSSSSGQMPEAVMKAKEAVRSAAAATAIPAVAPAKERERIQGAPAALSAHADEEELDEFIVSLRTQLEIFVNRMKSNSSRGRPIANDTSVQTLFMNVMAMHSKLVKYIQEQEDSRVHYEGLQDKLSQVKDARAALDALREEERERRRREAEEAERQRQIQLAQKLEVMRKKKAEYLEYQRQMAMQRMAEQEREMAKIQEAAKQNYLQQQQGLYTMYLPYGYAAAPTPGYPGMPQHQLPMMSAVGQQQPMGMLPAGQQQQPMGMIPPAVGQLPPSSGQQQPMGMMPQPQQPMLPPIVGQQPPMAVLPSSVQQQQQQPQLGPDASSLTAAAGAPPGAGFNPVYGQQAMYYPGMMAAPAAAAPSQGMGMMPGAPYAMQSLAAALPDTAAHQQQPPQQLQQQQLPAAGGSEDTTLISFD